MCLLDAEHTHSPLAPTFCTPGLKVPSTKTSTAMVSTNSSSNDLETKERTSLVSNSDECFENFADPSSPTISSYENLLKTPTPPEVTTIPEDIRQVIFLGYCFGLFFLQKDLKWIQTVLFIRLMCWYGSKS